MLHVASVCTRGFCMLFRVAWSCCANFETGQTFSHAQGRNSSQPWLFLRPFANSSRVCSFLLCYELQICISSTVHETVMNIDLLPIASGGFFFLGGGGGGGGVGSRWKGGVNLHVFFKNIKFRFSTHKIITLLKVSVSGLFLNYS